MTIASWNEMRESEHFVQFCESDVFLMNTLSEFIGTGLKAGDACIVLATKHRCPPEEKTYPGLGIGLYISCKIVKRHGGHLWVESKKGEGARFHVTLPLFHEGKKQASR
jgi:light-regulated signal transduction histidine kinase (bacteriophytochrome)